MRLYRAQGATEYLVLLAVVLIVALVSVALLGFFPGMAADAQETQSKAYWASASPIAIVEWAAKGYDANPAISWPYLRIRNTGGYPVRITKMLGGSGNYITVVSDCSAARNISDLYYLSPGEEAYFGSNMSNMFPQLPLCRHFDMQTAASSNLWDLGGLNSACGTATARGTLVMKDFGFEYIEYVEGQQITKREVGAKPLAIKCA